MLENLIHLIRSEPWQVAIELVIIWICVYAVFMFLRGTRGAGIIKGLAVILVGLTLTIRLLGESSEAFSRISFIYQKFIGVFAILLIVVFQPELRQAMTRISRAISFRSNRSSLAGCVDAVSEAVAFLSKSQFGAIIAIERESRLGELLETGTRLDAEVSARLLESIFWPNSPLHDLGVIIRGDCIAAASVQFPLVEEGVLGGEYGSRHRAAVGLTMESDCLVVVVSEETGNISIAEHGRLQSVGREEFRDVLAARLAAPVPAEGLELDGDAIARRDESADEARAA